jgi:hypothetical protein
VRNLVFSFAPHEARCFRLAPSDPTRDWTSAQLAEHVRTEHSTFTWLLEPMLERTLLAEPVRLVAHWLPPRHWRDSASRRAQVPLRS